MIQFFSLLLKPLLRLLDFLTPVGDFIARVWVARIFFMAGLTKLQSWDATLSLFHHEYQVPLLPADWAAYIGTYAELILPVLLVLGLGGRFIIFCFFIYNLVAAVSYPQLWTADGALGLDQHINWGILLMLLMFHGAGKLSVDHWLRKKYGHLLFKPQA